jgi:hypothetical protein
VYTNITVLTLVGFVFVSSTANQKSLIFDYKQKKDKKIEQKKHLQQQINTFIFR